MIGKYTEIEKVTYKDNTEGYMLTGQGVGDGFEVDMNSDFWFDNIGVVKRETVQNVSSLQEVVDFCKENNISFNSCEHERLKDNILRVGGEADMLVNSNLEFDWIEEQLFYS